MLERSGQLRAVELPSTLQRVVRSYTLNEVCVGVKNPRDGESAISFDFTLYARACHPVFQHDVRLHHAYSLVWLVLPFGNEFKFESDVTVC